MFWKKTINEMKHLSLVRYKNTQDRINKISDYIQGPLAEKIEEASLRAVEDKYNMIWERFKELQREYVNDYNRLNKRQNEICRTFEKLTNKKNKKDK